MINEEETILINYLIEEGFGYRKFAESVKKQGWVSKRQLETMELMKSKIKRYEHNKNISENRYAKSNLKPQDNYSEHDHFDMGYAGVDWRMTCQ